MKRWILPVTMTIVFVGILVGLAVVILPRFFSETSASSWAYRFPQYDLTMTLPSGDWQEVKKQDSDAAFVNRKHSTLAGVTVAKGDRAAFQKAVKRMKDHFDGEKGELREARCVEGETDAGYPFTYWVAQTKADADAFFVATSLVWCADKGLVVRTMMEGPLRMRSETGKRAELDFYEQAAKTICLSPR